MRRDPRRCRAMVSADGYRVEQVLLQEPFGGFQPDIDGLVAFACERLSDNSNEMQRLRRQLGDADADERHAFLVLGHEQIEGWVLSPIGREDDEEMGLPTVEPLLPEPIDGLWLTTELQHTRVVAYLPGTGWIEGKTPPTS